MAHVGIVKARSDAWSVAEAYAKLESEAERQVFIKQRDAQVAAIGNRILWPPMLLKLMVSQLRVFERGTIARKVRVLDRRLVSRQGVLMLNVVIISNVVKVLFSRMIRVAH